MDNNLHQRLYALENEIRGIRVGLKDFDHLSYKNSESQKLVTTLIGRVDDLNGKLDALQANDEERDSKTSRILAAVEQLASLVELLRNARKQDERLGDELDSLLKQEAANTEGNSQGLLELLNILVSRYSPSHPRPQTQQMDGHPVANQAAANNGKNGQGLV